MNEWFQCFPFVKNRICEIWIWNAWYWMMICISNWKWIIVSWLCSCVHSRPTEISVWKEGFYIKQCTISVLFQRFGHSFSLVLCNNQEFLLLHKKLFRLENASILKEKIKYWLPICEVYHWFKVDCCSKSSREEES